jgi:hypothetical protein
MNPRRWVEYDELLQHQLDSGHGWPGRHESMRMPKDRMKPEALLDLVEFRTTAVCVHGSRAT